MSHDPNLAQIVSMIKGRKPKAGLYVVATPIGNKWDITLRALQTLQGVDWIAAEDTRHSQKLLMSYGIDAKMISYHDFNELTMANKLADKIAAGESVALISDAGTPLISDPGYRLLQACIAKDMPITILPGASAVIASLAVAGLPPMPMHFIGFLPLKGRSNRLQELKKITATLLFFESPNRLVDSLQDCLAVFGDIKGAVVRELSKTFEEIRRNTLSQLIAHYQANEPRGEICVLLDNNQILTIADADVDALLQKALPYMSVKDAVEQVARDSGTSKRDVYKRALQLQQPETARETADAD